MENRDTVYAPRYRRYGGGVVEEDAGPLYMNRWKKYWQPLPRAARKMV